jgi:predicted nucleotidyltransferase
MRLRPDELVAGVPARKARDLFRHFHDGIRLEGIADRLRLPEEDAAEVLKNLLEQGFIEPSDNDSLEKGWYDLTAKARAVRNAKFLKPLPRARAEKLVEEAIARCRAANLNGDFTHYVKRLHVFGSYNCDSPDVGDVDLVIEIVPRPGIGNFVGASLERAKALGKRPHSYVDEVMFGWREVLLFVKGRSPYMTFHQENELESDGAAAGAVVLFEADPAEVRESRKTYRARF